MQSKAASTRVFSIPELVDSVVENTYTRHSLHKGASICKGKKTLFMLTRVDKTISKIACSKLWKNIISFKPLIDLLPPDLISDGVNENNVASLRVRHLQFTTSSYLLVLDTSSSSCTGRPEQISYLFVSSSNILSLGREPHSDCTLRSSPRRCTRAGTPGASFSSINGAINSF